MMRDCPMCDREGKLGGCPQCGLEAYWERWATAEQLNKSIGAALGGPPASGSSATYEAMVERGMLRKRKRPDGHWEYAPHPPPEHRTN